VALQHDVALALMHEASSGVDLVPTHYRARPLHSITMNDFKSKKLLGLCASSSSFSSSLLAFPSLSPSPLVSKDCIATV
jgi:hypothetical protein